MLVIRVDKNNYRPLEWEQLPEYNKEDLTTLEGIDQFTSKQKDYNLLSDIMDKSLVEPNDFFQSFAIIYREKGRVREVKEGVIFIEESNSINDKEIINLIKDNYSNKNLINHIINILNKNNEQQTNKELIVILKNLNFFAEKSKNALIAALDKYKELPYKEKRTIGLNILKKLNK
jgi:hypothetical protein